MVYHESLDFLGQPYYDYLEAKAHYDRVREELFGSVRDQVSALIEKQTKSEDILNQSHGMRLVQYYDSDFKSTKKEEREIFGMYIGGSGDNNEGNVFVTEMNKIAPEGFDGNRHVFGNFFGENVDSFGRFKLGKKILELHYKQEKAKLVEEARYKGVRQKEAILFQAFCRYLGEDYKGIFLYAASGPTSFCRNLYGENRRDSIGKLGHWDYVDSAFKEEPSMYGYKQGNLDKLRTYGITNPEQIWCDDIFRTSGANKLDEWEYATESNKSTRIISSYVGSINWPSEEVQYGIYDIAFAESDQTGEERLTAGELYKLAKIGGYIIIPHYLIKFLKRTSCKTKLLLDNLEGDFSLLQKIA